MPTGQALRLCPAATVAPVPRKLCGDKSRDIRPSDDSYLNTIG
jgi:hypothetical protein